MGDLVRTVEGGPLFILKANIIRNIITDVYALAETIEWKLRYIQPDHRRAEKNTYKTKNMEITLCQLKANDGIRLHMKFGKGNDLYNDVFFTIDKDGDYSISIESAEINNLIATHADILELLLDLTNNRNYTFLRALLPEEHAIIIDNKPIITCIRSNRDTDKMYYKLKRDKTRYVYEDTKYDAVVCLDLKAAHVNDGFLLR